MLWLFLLLAGAAFTGNMLANKERKFNDFKGTNGGTLRASDAPIEILFDDGLDAFPNKTGLGTVGNPYIIKDMVIDAGGSGYGISISFTTKYLTIENCTVNGYSSGIYLYAVQNVMVTGNTLVNNTEGIQFRSSTGNGIFGNNIRDNYNGIYVYQCTGANSISANNITDNENTGITLSNSNGMTVSGNNVMNNSVTGIQSGSSVCIISGNSVTNGSYAGISISGSYNEVSGNTITSSQRGISISSNYNEVSGNNATYNTDYGIIIQGASHNVLDSNNVSCNQYGLYVTSNSINNTISSNHALQNNIHGIFVHLNANNNTLSNNVAMDNQFYGLHVYQCSNNTLLSNTASYNAAGIAVFASTFNQISGNNASMNSEGIVLSGGSNNTISDNNAWNNTASGIRLQSNSDSNTISRNTVSNNTGSGISMFQSDTSAVLDNTVLNNTAYGIALVDSSNNVISGNLISGNMIAQANSSASDDSAWDNGTRGNYWGDYMSRYPSATSTNGVWNTAYEIFDGGQDRYPLTFRPGTPRDVVAQGGNQQITVTWLMPVEPGVAPVTNYSFYWSGDNVSFTKEVLGIVFEYQHAALGNNETYYYKVAAVNAHGEGQNSTVVSATSWEVPGQVTGLVATPGDNHVDLSWNAPSNGGTPITGYNVYWSTDNIVFSKIPRGTGTTFQHAMLENGIAIYYMVAAVNAMGEGANSSVEQATPGAAPSEPQNVLAFAGHGAVNLTWTAPADIGGFLVTAYNVYRDGVLVHTTPDGTTTGFNDTGLGDGVQHAYKVSAVNVIGEGANSTEVLATTWDVPGQVTGLVATAGNGHVNLTWSAPGNGGSPITGYNLYWSTDNAIFTIEVLGNVTAHTDGMLGNGETRYYKIAAANAVGEGANSTVAQATTWDVPGQVTGLVATPGNGHVNLTWSIPGNGGSPITGYSVHWSTDNVTFTTIPVGDVTAYTLGSLGNGETLHFKVSATNAIGEGANSSVATATTWDVPGQVTGLVATPDHSLIMLAWVDPVFVEPPITMYYIYWSADGLSFTKLDEQAWANYYHSYSTGLEPGHVYYYKVSAVNAMGEGANSTVVSARTWAMPGQVTGFNATAGNGHVNLTWNAPGGAWPAIHNYKIVVNNHEMPDQDVDGSMTAWQVQGLTNDVEYTFVIVAINAMGESVPSVPIVSTPVDTNSGTGDPDIPGGEPWLLSALMVVAIVGIIITKKNKRA